MKKLRLILFSIAFVLTACSTTVSDTALETAVSQAIMTSAALEAKTRVTEQALQPNPADSVNQKAQEDLAAAQLQLTEQAARVAGMQAELDRLSLLLTPSDTPTPTESPIPTITNTPTITPTPGEPGLPSDQKYVKAGAKTPIYTFKEKNDAGKPIMVKVAPVQRFEPNEVFIVERALILADGGSTFYQIVGPKYSGYYVSVNDVTDYTP